MSARTARFPRIAAVLLAGAALAAGLLLLVPGRREAAERPNIVLVVWDTTRADRLSAYGYARKTTPWLDGFARDAVLFREAFSPSPWTPPAHGSLFTGLLPRRHGLHHGRGDRIAPGVPLLAETLRDGGYETVGFSSNLYVSPVTGVTGGIDRLRTLFEPHLGMGTVDMTMAAVDEWLRERRAAPAPRRPLFLFVNLMEAHLPRRPSPEDLAAVTGAPYPSSGVERALLVEQNEAIAHLLGFRRIDPETLAGMSVVYDAALHLLDRGTAQVMDRLRGEGILEGAVVAIVGDHGEHLGEHGNLSHQMSLHDEVLRIPMVLRWPGRFEGGRVETAQVRLQDLHPTLLEAAGLAVPEGTGTDARTLTESPLRGRPLLAEFRRPGVFLEEARKGFIGAPDSCFARFQVSLLAAQDPVGVPGARKLVRSVDAAGPGERATQREELYDLAADPGEERDLLVDPSPEDLAAARRLASGL